MVDGTCLENKRGETYREFESRPLRQIESKNDRIVICGHFVFSNKALIKRLCHQHQPLEQTH